MLVHLPGRDSWDGWVANAIRNSVASEVASRMAYGCWGRRTVAVLLALFCCFVMSQPLVRRLTYLGTEYDKLHRGGYQFTGVQRDESVEEFQ